MGLTIQRLSNWPTFEYTEVGLALISGHSFMLFTENACHCLYLGTDANFDLKPDPDDVMLASENFPTR